jgi:hypothetical protein
VNVIDEVKNKNGGFVLVHSASIKDFQNILESGNENAEVCTSASNLEDRKGLYSPQGWRGMHVGVVYDPSEAITFFSKDVGSRREGEKGKAKSGKRILTDPDGEKYRCKSFEEAIQKQQGSRIEAWVDAKKTKPLAIFPLINEKKQEVEELGNKYGIPVLNVEKLTL